MKLMWRCCDFFVTNGTPIDSGRLEKTGEVEIIGRLNLNVNGWKHVCNNSKIG
jgi:hypothetical protein